jgi:hypothetical protein
MSKQAKYSAKSRYQDYLTDHSDAYFYIIPMPPPIPPIGISDSFFGISVIAVSVVKNIAATEAAFSSALRLNAPKSRLLVL